MKLIKSTPAFATLLCAIALAAPSLTTQAAVFKVLWWDSTPEYGGQAPDALRKEMSDYLTNFSGGTVFNSTYVSSETPGTLSTHLASNSYDVIMFDATSAAQKFDAADQAAAKDFFSTKSNLLLDGNLYVRSIDFNATADFPGVNGSTGGLVVNEVYQLGSRGGGIMIGTDHDGFQTDANQILNALIPAASFTGITEPSTDGVFFGEDLLNSKVPIAAADLFAHFDSIPSQGVAPTGAFTDSHGRSVTLYSQLEVADDPGGGPRRTYISTSWAPGKGQTDVTDPNPGGGGGGGNAVPEGGATLMLLGAALASLLGLARINRKR